MRRTDSQNARQVDAEALPIQMHSIEGREWWLWAFAVTVTLVLTLGIVSLTFPWLHLQNDSTYWFDLREWVRALAGLVVLFDIYTVYQHIQLRRVRRQLVEHGQLFRLISENAADMIALVDSSGRRLYNSPSYQKILGYTAEDLETSSMEQIHPDDRQRVLEAADRARVTGHGQTLVYRIRHKNGTWRILESTASAILDAKGQTDKLVIVNRDITERKRVEEMLAHNTYHDGLTNLPNRALFLDRLQHPLGLSRRHADYKFAVLLLDVDDFKVVNDSLGQAAGNDLLIQIGQRLTTCIRRLDTVARTSEVPEGDTPPSDDRLARLGGDEFAMILDDIRDPSDAVRVAERIQSKLAAPFTVNGQELVVAASLGIALSTTPRAEAEDLLRDADLAMHRAKQAGKSRYEIFDTAMHASAIKRLRLETDLRKALDQDELRVYYQPIVSLQTGKITGFEALTRWQRGDTLISPAEFMSVADETGLIIPMNRLLMREACLQLLSWHAQFPSDNPFAMSVNVSPKQFAQPDLASDIETILRETGLDPRYLHLEIIETIAMADAEGSGNVLNKLRSLGVRLSIDDFGTGYSSLSRLRRFPIDTLKIDRSFISNMDHDAESREIVRIIITLAHNLGLEVVAEGTETEGQVTQLKRLNCERAQGYFFSRPADHKTVTAMLASDYVPNQKIVLRAELPGNPIPELLKS